MVDPVWWPSLTSGPPIGVSSRLPLCGTEEQTILYHKVGEGVWGGLADLVFHNAYLHQAISQPFILPLFSPKSSASGHLLEQISKEIRRERKTLTLPLTLSGHHHSPGLPRYRRSRSSMAAPSTDCLHRVPRVASLFPTGTGR